MDGTRDTARQPLNVLVLYDHARSLTGAEHERLAGLAAPARHRVYFAPATHGARLGFSLELFDAVVLDGSVHPGDLAADFAEALPRFAGLKALVLPGGHAGCAERVSRLGVDLVFTRGPVGAGVTVSPGAHARHTEFVELPNEAATLSRVIGSALERRVGTSRGHRFLTRLVGAPSGPGTIAPMGSATCFSLPVPVHTLPPLTVTKLDPPELPWPCQGRLTLLSGSPFTNEDCWSDVLYFTPCDGNRVALFGPNGWEVHSFYELALRLERLPGGTIYDVFLTRAGVRGALHLEPEPWVDGERRRLELMRHDGVWVQHGKPQRRYLGTFRSSIAGVAEDSHTKRFLWNLYYPQEKHLLAHEMTCHEHAGPPRPWNGDTAFHFALVLGLPERVGVRLSAFLRPNRPGELARVHVTLDGADDMHTELGGRVENATAQFLGAATGGGMVLSAGHHTIGAAEEAGPGGGLFANVWLRGRVRG